MNDIKELDREYIADTYARFPLALTNGKGALLYDDGGKEYIDFGSGIAVNSFGAADPEWAAAVAAQANALQHTSNLYYTSPSAELAALMCEKTGMKKVFFSNSGAEANECAIKAARRYAYRKYGDGHSTVITLKNSFHGRTLATLAATGQDSFHTEFGPFPEGFVYADPGDAESVRRLSEKQPCAALMMEMVQGEGGVNALSEEFVREAVAIAKEKDMLVIVDEVQTGNGRTGALYAYMHYGISPDIVTTAKGLGGGLPIGATLFSEKAKDIYTPGSHGSTFGGNPVCCAGALSIYKRLDDTLFEEVKRKSAYLLNRLTGAAGVKSISGLGLMLGIETEKPAKEVIAAAMEKGLLILSAKNKVRLLPPLNIGNAELSRGTDILLSALKV